MMGMVALAMFLSIAFGAIPQATILAEAATETVTVNGTDIGEFKIVHLSTATETEIRPFVKGFDQFSLGAGAAAELQTLIAQATGQTLEIVTTDDWVKVAGDKEILLTFDPSVDGDAFAVEVAGSSITITGGIQHGVWYGLYDFLEEALGYRFFGKTMVVQDKTYVDAESANVSGDAIDLVDRAWSETPGFSYRNTSALANTSLAEANGWDEVTHSFFASYNYEGIRSLLSGKLNGGDNDKWAIAYPQYGGMKGTVMSHAHAFESLLAGYNLRGASSSDQPCLADEETYDVLLAEVLELIAWEYGIDGFPIEHTSNFNIDRISLGWNDNTNYCTCDGCLAYIEETGSLTDAYIDYINRIAAVVAEEYPDIQLLALAYNVCTEPPVNVIPAENVDIYYCHYTCNSHSLLDALNGAECDGPPGLSGMDMSCHETLENLQGWLAVTDNVYIWEYMDGFGSYIAQAPFYDFLYEEFSTLYDLGVKGVYAETRTDWHPEARYGFEDMRDYLMAAMLWDPEMSREEYDTLAKEFIAYYYYGDPAAEVDEIYDYLVEWDDAGTDENPSCWMNNYSSIKAVNNLEYYAEHGEEMEALLDAALAKVTDETCRARIQYLKVSCRYLTLSGQYVDRYTNGDEASKEAYLQDYQKLHDMALTDLPTPWLDYYINWLREEYDAYIYTTADGVCIDYCPLAWYFARDGFHDVDPYYYTVNFMMNDGTDAVFEAQRIGNFWAVALDENPVRPGYIFRGWYLEEACENEFVFEYGGTKITGANTTDGIYYAYAAWEPCEEHAWDEGVVTIEPTYQEPGELTYTCEHCGETYTEAIEMLVCEEHAWDEGVVTKEPTSNEEGEKTFTCENCGETKTEAIAKLNPPTGDAAMLWLYGSLMMGAAVMAVALLFTKKRSW